MEIAVFTHSLFVWLLCDCVRAIRDQPNISRPQFGRIMAWKRYIFGNLLSRAWCLTVIFAPISSANAIRNSSIPRSYEYKIFSFHTKGTQRIEENRIVLRLFISLRSNPTRSV